VFGGPTDIFAKMNRHGIGPTVRGAERVVVTSPTTGQDVVAEWNVPAERLRIVPVACEPHTRFEGVSPQAVPVPGRDFILNVANAAAHKGGEVMLAGYAKLKARLGDATPPLVMCGFNTLMFSPALRDKAGVLPPDLQAFVEPQRPKPNAPDHPHWQNVRRILTSNGLREGRDVYLLGYVDDAQLADLFSRAGVVVNAARYDNGTYSLIEAAWFGKPGISTRYPSAEWLYGRFGLPVRYFPVNDTDALSATLAESLADRPDTGRIRSSLASPEFSHRQFAERLYDVLVELAEDGRRRRLSRGNTESLRRTA
jgi:glycosyltransferase involved in cell wall biosynthesis